MSAAINVGYVSRPAFMLSGCLRAFSLVGLLAGFFFKSGHPFQLTLVSIHIQEKIQFGCFGQVALQVNGRFFGIETCCQILNNYLSYIPLQILQL